MSMPHWAEGLAAAYAVAALAMGFVFVFGTDLPWLLKFWGAVLWPVTAVLVLWSVAMAGAKR